MCVLAGGVRTQSPGALAIPVALWPILLAVAGLAVDLRVVRSHGGAVQAFPAAHCVKQKGPVSKQDLARSSAHLSHFRTRCGPAKVVPTPGLDSLPGASWFRTK